MVAILPAPLAPLVGKTATGLRYRRCPGRDRCLSGSAKPSRIVSCGRWRAAALAGAVHQCFGVLTSECSVQRIVYPYVACVISHCFVITRPFRLAVLLGECVHGSGLGLDRTWVDWCVPHVCRPFRSNAFKSNPNFSQQCFWTLELKSLISEFSKLPTVWHRFARLEKYSKICCRFQKPFGNK